MTVDISNRKEQRKFGLVMGVAICALGFIRWGVHGFGPLPWHFFYAAAAFAALGLVLPGLLKPLFWIWLKFGLVMNYIMTRVLLTLAFFLLIVPTRLILLVLRKDTLNRSWDPEALTYWDEPEEQPEELDAYLNQF
ncbi:MAG: hypothetical protein GWP08_01715 [Nitrospiraceae bacterium]|nr:hypothetical protein [Nitrospiraceae bacterium]